ANEDQEFRTRALIIKEQRAELVKHHLWVLWTDYFKAPHFEKYPQLHPLFNEATKLAGASGAKSSTDVKVAEQLLSKIDEIAKIFWETKQARPTGPRRRPSPAWSCSRCRPTAPTAGCCGPPRRGWRLGCT